MYKWNILKYIDRSIYFCEFWHKQPVCYIIIYSVLFLEEYLYSSEKKAGRNSGLHRT